MSDQKARLNSGHQLYGLNAREREAQNLVRVCAKCGKNMGEKPPLDDKSQTHGYCDACLKFEMAAAR